MLLKNVGHLHMGQVQDMFVFFLENTALFLKRVYIHHREASLCIFQLFNIIIKYIECPTVSYFFIYNYPIPQVWIFIYPM